MEKYYSEVLRICILTLVLASTNAKVSAQKFLTESPKQTVTQNIGFTDITIKYYRPGVKSRTIFGEMIRYDKVWRTGANYPTTITFTDTVIIEDGHVLSPGNYALYTIPNKDHWTIIFSSNTKLWGAYGYKQTEDALRVDVRPEKAKHTETFNISIEDIAWDSALLCLQWETIKVPVRLKFDFYPKVESYVESASQDSALRNDWSVYWKAAKYFFSRSYKLDKAEKWLDHSLAIDSNYINLWAKAELLALRHDYTNAIKLGELAVKKGNIDDPLFPYGPHYETSLKNWRRMNK